MIDKELLKLSRDMTGSEYCSVVPANSEDSGEPVDNQFTHASSTNHLVILIKNKSIFISKFIFFNQDVEFAGQNTFYIDSTALSLLNNLLFQTFIEYNIDRFLRLLHDRPVFRNQ